MYSKYGVITNDVSYYINLLVRIAHIICNHLLSLFSMKLTVCVQTNSDMRVVLVHRFRKEPRTGREIWTLNGSSMSKFGFTFLVSFIKQSSILLKER
jgi:hypothetical protein